jgi:hypothetical protein
VFGLATVGALFAVLVHLDPRDGQGPAAAISKPAPAEGAAGREQPPPPKAKRVRCR